MALLKCVECGGKVSSRATACPHCGCPVDDGEIVAETIKSNADEPKESFNTIRTRESVLKKIREVRNSGERVLELSSNFITDLTPFRELTNLRTLTLNQNLISDIDPLRELTQLEILNLEENRISDFRPLQD